MKRSLFAEIFFFGLLALWAVPASAQIFSGLGDAAPGDDGISFAIMYRQMSPQSEFRDGGTFDASGGLAYFDARGWGTLLKGTPLHFPVPALELNALPMPIYTFGGQSDAQNAAQVENR